MPPPSITVIGGIPQPIGGVTTFIGRLASHNMISEIIDIYPSTHKKSPPHYVGKCLFLKGKLNLLWHFWLFRSPPPHANGWVHFNFSTMKGALIALLLPKKNERWCITLHHGTIKSVISPALTRFALRRFDKIYSLGNQNKFYYSLNIEPRKLIATTSYLPPIISEPPASAKHREICAFLTGKHSYICSGYPEDYYNHTWCINYVRNNSNSVLAIFLYGQGQQEAEIQKAAADCDRVKIFYDVDEDTFNYALRLCTAYLRPTSRDSFGIAVADAVELGTVAIASNVCRRHPGAYEADISTYLKFESLLTSFEKNGEISGGKKSNYPIRKFSYESLEKT